MGQAHLIELVMMYKQADGSLVVPAAGMPVFLKEVERLTHLDKVVWGASPGLRVSLGLPAIPSMEDDHGSGDIAQP